MDKLKSWLKAAGIRAVKTAAQAAVAIIPVSGATLGEVDWVLVAGSAALAGILSLLTSIGGIPEADDGASVIQIVKDGE